MVVGGGGVHEQAVQIGLNGDERGSSACVVGRETQAEVGLQVILEEKRIEKMTFGLPAMSVAVVLVL